MYNKVWYEEYCGDWLYIIIFILVYFKFEN